MEGSQPAYPLVFLILESLAFTASTLCSSSVTNLSQLLLRGVDVVHQGLNLIYSSLGASTMNQNALVQATPAFSEHYENYREFFSR